MNGPPTPEGRLPVARPVASSGHARLRTSGDTRGRSEVGNHLPSSGRLGRRQLVSLSETLSDRDIAILRLVAGHRFIATTQIEQLVFSDHSTSSSGARACRRVLRRLHRQGVLTALERRIGGIRAGSASYVWRLSHAGQRLLNLLDGEDSVAKLHEPSERLLNHCLMVAETHVSIRQFAREHGLDVLDVTTEPHCWRTYHGMAGELRTLKPDLGAITATPEYVDHWLLEADTGSEHPPTTVLKCRQYLDYFATLPSGDIVPRVIWVVPSHKRADRLRRAFLDARLDPRLFKVTELSDLGPVLAGGAS